MKYQKKPEYVEAMFVDDALFDDDHPNPNHLTGILYDPIKRTATLDSPYCADETIAQLGDVVVRYGSFDSIWREETFLRVYQPVT